MPLNAKETGDLLQILDLNSYIEYGFEAPSSRAKVF